ncbi:putative membrane protein YphA (DoxX/SURF4 family) [Bacillus sp. SORGH_AS 510]|uniref:hypothetical protein n=1 Tax=Bacillus sp. SORGH_AS_0510 TaxID=3041771 RepID=UPI0027802461|nr:hypothetical protein [Bacillus sp. SORGH_AS_0510]MDQ1143594.1 putative membrane protein YphA (DoxX/SURF4 family) [Bacillus sp. SORGH_AS_0510]
MVLFFLLIYFVIITAVIEIFVVLFRLTGLKVEVSRFQVISMMTGTGFTTGESELILGHPIRRKLAIFLILFGAFSLAVIISSISQFLSEGLRTKEIITVAVGTLLVFVVLKLAWIQRVISKVFNRKMKQNVALADMPVRDVFLSSKKDAVLNLPIYHESSLHNRTIHDVIPEYQGMDFGILFIQRGGMKLRKNVYGTVLHEGDQLLLYGDKKVLWSVFEHDWKVSEEKRQDEGE